MKSIANIIFGIIFVLIAINFIVSSSLILPLLSLILLIILFILFIKTANAGNRHVQQEQSLREELDCMIQKQKDFISTEKISVINKFASVAGHELKNPLASLKNIAYYLSKTNHNPDDKAKKMLGMLSSEIDRMDGMLNELSAISRCRRINKSSINVAELIETVVKTIPLNNNINVIKNIEPIEASIDPERYAQLIAHLITNARDAMPEGGELTISLSQQERYFIFSVQDTGCGMDEETCLHIFEPMFTTKTKVLGMGLTVVKEIVTMHNGTISVESEKNKGSLVKITLPL
jgi:signal transduction histidine kinase